MKRLVAWLIRRAQRHPYFHLPGYMNRWWLLGHGTSRDQDPDGVVCNPGTSGRLAEWFCSRFFTIRVHEILRSDVERDLHDHPAWSISIVLRGGYYEETPRYPYMLTRATKKPEPVRVKWHGPGSIVIRRHATDRHRLILRRGESTWSIFIVGRKSNEWGFYTPEGKVHWREYEYYVRRNQEGVAAPQNAALVQDRGTAA